MLQIFEKYAGKGAFQPEELLILVAAFDDAWKRLENSGVRFDSNYQREQARNTLGKFIIEGAKKGERDKHRLIDNALLFYGKSQFKKSGA
jgi:hypothetical protein